MKNFYEYLCEIGFKCGYDKLPQDVAMEDSDGVLMDYNDFGWYMLTSETFRKSAFIKTMNEKEIILVRKRISKEEA